MDAHLATTLRTAETLLLSPPVQVVPDAVLRDSWRVASQLDARAPADVLAGLDPATARGSVEGCLFQLKLFRIFLGRLCEPSDEPAAARLAEAVAEVLGELRDSGESGAALAAASGGESSSESESSASEDEPDAPLDAGDALDASISSDDSDDETAGAARPAAAAVRLALDRASRDPASPPAALAAAMATYADDAAALELGCARLAAHYRGQARRRARPRPDGEATAEAAAVSAVVLSALRQVNLAPTQGGAAAHRRSTLEAVAAATGGPEGAVFVERFAALGGLAALLDTLQHAAPDEASQVAGLGVLGHVAARRPPCFRGKNGQFF